jgi:hypothetical protein
MGNYLDYYVNNGLLLISSRDRAVDQKFELLRQDLKQIKKQMRAAK